MTTGENGRTPIRVRPGVPVAITVANHLRGRLRREFAHGGQLPSETVLAAELAVSRGTIRQALSILQHEGLITRRQGLGTFARPDVEGIPARIDFAYEFTELINAAGYVAEVKTLEISQTCAGPEGARRLGIPADTSMLRLRKLFLADGLPAIYVDEMLPIGLIVEEYDPEELKRPIWRFLEHRCHRKIKYVLSEVMPAIAQGELVELMALEAGSPVLKFIEMFFDVHNTPQVLANIYFRDGLVRFHAWRRVAPVI